MNYWCARSSVSATKHTKRVIKYLFSGYQVTVVSPEMRQQIVVENRLTVAIKYIYLTPDVTRMLWSKTWQSQSHWNTGRMRTSTTPAYNFWTFNLNSAFHLDFRDNWRLFCTNCGLVWHSLRSFFSGLAGETPRTAPTAMAKVCLKTPYVNAFITTRNAKCYDED